MEKLLIIPTYNERDNVAQILKVVFDLQQEFHVLIIDDGSPDGTASIVKELQKEFPGMPVVKVDERYSSKMAKRAMIEMGMKKKDRQNKRNVDEIAATMMLQEYMGGER